MSSILFGIFLIWNIIIFYLYYKKDYGIFQIPCLFATISFIFVVPQLYQISNLTENTDGYMTLSLFVIITSNIALTLGFEYASRYPISNHKETTFIPNRLWLVIVFFAIIGIGATLLNRGVYKGGFISGTFVTISFFASYLDYLLVLILVSFYKKIQSPWFVYALLGVTILLQVDKFLISARRGEAIQFVLSLSFFYFYIHSKSLYHRFKWIIPAFFIMGMIMNSQIGEYRTNAYSGKVSIIDNITRLNVPRANETKTLKNLEMNNAFLGINACYKNGIYDYGTANWNGLVKSFIPRSLTGTVFKESLMFNNNNKMLISYLCRSGSTMTGYFDAFSSFGIFACLIFLILGVFMGSLWRKINTSTTSLLLYITSMSASLHTITHSTNNITSDLFFFIMFVYPFIRYCTIRVENT